MTPKTSKITRGPSAFDMVANLFRPSECPTLCFQIGCEPDGRTAVSIECARRVDAEGNEWELELYVPFTAGYRLRVHYNTHTRQGEVLEYTLDTTQDPRYEVSDREMHRAFDARR